VLFEAYSNDAFYVKTAKRKRSGQPVPVLWRAAAKTGLDRIRAGIFDE